MPPTVSPGLPYKCDHGTEGDVQPCLHPHDCESYQTGKGHVFISLEPEESRKANEEHRASGNTEEAAKHGKWRVSDIGTTGGAWSVDPNVCNVDPGLKNLEMNGPFWGQTSHTITWK